VQKGTIHLKDTCNTSFKNFILNLHFLQVTKMSDL